MKKTILLAFALALPMQAIANDSVYNWGTWSNGVKPAAGQIQATTPPPATVTKVNFRPNEASAFSREATAPVTIVTPPAVVTPPVIVAIAPPTPVITIGSNPPPGDPRARGR